jgi:DNA-binding NarL/FixJ family response regulator
MTSAFADPLSPRRLHAARERRAAVVIADASCREIVASLLAATAREWAGIVAVQDVCDLADHRPDAVVLVADFATPAGMATLRRVRSEVPVARLVVIARDDGSAFAARQALNAGAEAFVPAGEVDQALAAALDAVMAGLVCVPRAARRLIAKPTFSHREKEVLELLVTGLTNRQIAARLYLAESTVKSHLATVFAKLGVRSRKDAVALLLDPAEGLAMTALPPDAAASATSSELLDGEPLLGPVT